MSPDIPTHRILYRRSAGQPPYKLERLTERLPPHLPPTSVLIQVHAVSLNYRDCNMLAGTNPWPILENGTPCSDAVGTIIALGAHCTRTDLQVGNRVSPNLDQKAITGEEQERAWLGGEIEGVLASHIVFDESILVKIPKNLTWTEAACLPNAGVTAWSALATHGRSLVAGQTVLLQGTGGVSMMALKLALGAGCKVIITSSSDEKLKQIQETLSPASNEIQTINYATTSDWDKELYRLNNGSGADIVVENGGASSIMRSIRAAKKGGVVSQVGYLGRQDDAALDGLIPLLIDKTVNWRGINCGSRLDFEKLNAVIERAGLRFEDIIDKKFGFDEADKAFEYVWSGKHVGKVVVEIIQ